MQRRHFTRLIHHGVPRSETRRGFPQRDLQRVVPRADPHADAERFFGAVHPGVGAEGDRLPVEATAADEVGEEFEDVGPGVDIDGGGLREGFPRVVGLNAGDGVVARAEEGHGAEEDPRAGGGGGGRPDGEGGGGGVDGGVDVGGGRGVDVGEREEGGGVDGLEDGARGGLGAAGVEGAAGWVHGGWVVVELGEGGWEAFRA